MNKRQVIRHLIAKNVVKKNESGNGYFVIDRPNLPISRSRVLAKFCITTGTDSDGDIIYVVNDSRVNMYRTSYSWTSTSTSEDTSILRRLTRERYHSEGSTSTLPEHSRRCREALENIPADEDGIKRSFGIEYEVYNLTSTQEDKLARLLDTLPPHKVERDGSLGSNGAEIVFYPMGAQAYIDTVKKLADFVNTNNVSMEADQYTMAGMHTTYGVSNSSSSREDIQIRLNRIALATKAYLTQSQIKAIFGRDFGHYRELPTSTVFNTHANAFSINGRPSNCWECRLTSWKCNPEKMVNFFKSTEHVFQRPTTRDDLISLYDILGGDMSEA